MLLQCLLLWVVFPVYVLTAYVRTYTCGTNQRITNENDNISPLFESANPLADVLIRDEVIFYRVEFVTAVEINDVNYTTNTITTLQVESNFLNGAVLFVRKRLCDFVSIVPNNSNSSSDSTLWPGGDIPLADLFGLAPLFQNPDMNLTSPTIDNHNESSSSYTLPSSYVSAPPLISKREHSYDRNQTANDVCPLMPGIRYQILFASNTSTPRYFGSYETKFTFLSANEEIGCIQVFATPYHPTFITYPICFAVMGIFIFGFFTNFYIFHFSIHQETTNVFLFIASSICNEPLLNELTPDLTMLLNFLQFVLFSMALNISYPGFVQPIITFINWVCLIRIDIFSTLFISPLSMDGVYKSLGIKGIYGIFPEDSYAPDGETTSTIWKNFISWLWIVVLAVIAVTQIFISVKQHFTKNYKISGYQSRVFFAIGIITQMHYCVFPLPFITFSCFLILGLGEGSNVDIGAAVASIILLVIWIASICWFCLRYVILKKEKLYSSFKVISCWSALYHLYKPECSYFLILDKFKVFFQGIVIGFGQTNGIVQISLLIFAELVYLMALLYVQPFFNRNRNIWSIIISLTSFIIVGFNIPYIPELAVKTTYRNIFGDLQLLITGIAILGFFFFFVIRLVQVVRSRFKNKHEVLQYSDPSSNKSSMDEAFDREVINSDNINESHIYHPLRAQYEQINDKDAAFSFENEQSQYYRDKHPNFPRPKLDINPASTRGSMVSNDSSIAELTDHRALPGLSLSYLSSSENLPPVSPIDDEYLANLSNNDSELRKLWAKRTNFKQCQKKDNASSIDNSLLSKIKSMRSSVDTESNDKDRNKDNEKDLEKSSQQNKNFQVMGRKPIQVKSQTPNVPSTITSKKFEVIGRKPITVKDTPKKQEQ